LSYFHEPGQRRFAPITILQAPWSTISRGPFAVPIRAPASPAQPPDRSPRTHGAQPVAVLRLALRSGGEVRKRAGPPPSALAPVRLAVAHELDVTVAGDRAVPLGAPHGDGAFPVARSHDQLLVGEARRNLEHETLRNLGETPARGVGDAAARAAPGGEH